VRLRIARFLPRTVAEGPGSRACVWVQGCSIRCRGCFNPHTWDPGGGREIAVDDLVERLRRSAGIEGVTFLGGEPFDQAEAVAAVAAGARELGLSTMTFTGFTLAELRHAERPGYAELLDATDLLVDGPFRREAPDLDRPWVGSTNQRFHFLTPRYRHLADELERIPDRIEVRLHADGTAWLNGQADAPLLTDLKRIIRRGPA
jgi:anaerobic ribonucleoside-triphosphate reductase activating protein